MVKKNELKLMEKEALEKQLVELRKELIKINAQRAIKTTLDSPGRVKQLKKTIARIYTLLNQKMEVKKQSE